MCPNDDFGLAALETANKVNIYDFSTYIYCLLFM